jgi:lipopolysaccharide biosynthesis protein/2-polyprenyl-3-methyl-5-hydroxy-6-metoxy-1,4-benzoquinol methylase
MFQLEKSGYRFDTENKIWIRPDFSGIAYNDGDASEQKLAQIIKTTEDVSVFSVDLRRQCTEWAIHYHLSSQRGNILRPFEHLLQGSVLEIGAGCGAVSRYLGEAGGQILSLEGSPRRASIAASRTRDLENVTVLAERFDDFECNERFDAITLIGVLEYASMFSDGDSPALNMLSKIKKMLKPNGHLFIAIENQLGLKYFAGAPEDHIGEAMYGIEGRYQKDGPATFGRQGLEQLVNQAGYESVEFLAPFPDYKMPRSILTEEGCRSGNFDGAAFAWQSVKADPQLPKSVNFDLGLAWPVIFKNGLGIELANSFLVVANLGENKTVEDGALAFHYSTERTSAYCKETKFLKNGENGISVEYRLFSNTADLSSTQYRLQVPSKDRYHHGHVLSQPFIELLSSKTWCIQDVADYLVIYLGHLSTLLAKAGHGIDQNLHAGYKIPGEFIDAVPQNIIIDEFGAPNFIDMEWRSVDDVELGHLLFRSLLLLLNQTSNLQVTKQNPALTRKDFFISLYSLLGMPAAEEDLDRFNNSEVDFQKIVTGLPTESLIDWFPYHPLVTTYLSASIFYAFDDESFSEDRAMHQPLQIGRQKVTFPLSIEAASSLTVRCDPVDRSQWFNLYQLTISDDSEVVLWDHSSVDSSTIKPGLLEITSDGEGFLYYAYNDDPQFITPEFQLQKSKTLFVTLDIEILDGLQATREVLRLGESFSKVHEQAAVSKAESAQLYIELQKAQQETSSYRENLQLLQSSITSLTSAIELSQVNLELRGSELRSLQDSAEAYRIEAVALSNTVSEQNTQILELLATIATKDASIADLSSTISAERNNTSSLHEALTGRGGQLSELIATISERDTEISKLQAALTELLNSNSWAVTRPLRKINRIQGNMRNMTTMKHSLGRFAKRVYDNLPLSQQNKLRVKSTIFSSMAPVLKQTNSYKAWARNNTNDVPVANISEDFKSNGTDGSVQGSDVAARYIQNMINMPGPNDQDYCAISEAPIDHSALRARAIAYYLPQFHPTPENDEWWGKGFTEWTNVSKAVPQFIGHYQPHLPGELGFYDLRLVEVMERQAELAKLYGVEGFCFHYYWFGGRRILERPLEQLVNSEIDMPFCICWANENWTRRWDGLDNEVLLAQNYGPEDDLAFIKSLEPLLRDKRYIRVDGQPLIILYRPSLLPDAAATLVRWREYCREVGIGELFLCMVQFDKLDPREYGFDAAVEFPPHKVAANLPCINDTLEIANSNYAGYVVDYQDVVNRAAQEPVSEFPLIRGVFPSWDNDARKPGRGYTVANSTPAKYRTWLRSSIDYARANPVRGESLVFINAWNEWAEGAHLEPDRRYGYAYLEATKQALKTPPSMLPSPLAKQVCVVVHAFYPELLAEIFDYLKKWSTPYRLVITTIPEKELAVRTELETHAMEADVLVRDNRGRDILPFLRALETAVKDEHLILKLHTKKSLHREDGDTWRKDLLSKLLAPEKAAKVFAAFAENNDLGLIAPEGHILSMSTYWGSNADTVHRLTKQMGGDVFLPESTLFAAGSMFYVRSTAIRSITELGLRDSDFEEEAGQVDGTLAHAIERCFSVATWLSGYYLASSEHPEVVAYRSSETYAYAKPSV